MPSLKGPLSPNFGQEFAPALDSDPIFERPAEAHTEHAPAEESYAPAAKTGDRPSGIWADQRSGFDMETTGGAGFLDPGTYALSSHKSPVMESSTFHGGAMEAASNDLYEGPSSYGGGESSGGGGGGGDAGEVTTAGPAGGGSAGFAD